MTARENPDVGGITTSTCEYSIYLFRLQTNDWHWWTRKRSFGYLKIREIYVWTEFL